jgi:hypothetical protein
MSKFKAGDEVVVVEDHESLISQDYRYVKGYIFTIAAKKRGDEIEWLYEEGDDDWYTTEDCLRHATPLDKILK